MRFSWRGWFLDIVYNIALLFVYKKNNEVKLLDHLPDPQSEYLN